LFVGSSYNDLYSPSTGIAGVPQFTCPRISLQRNTELDRPDKLEDGTILRRCAEYYNDKELSKMDTGELFAIPEESTTITFRDYGGIPGPDGIVSEFIDTGQVVGDIPDTFWVKQKYPDLTGVRLFSAGNFDIVGGFEGGSGVSGSFAGSMVFVFGTTTGRKNFDTDMGHKNIKLTFINDVAGQVPSIEGCEFVGRPSRNPTWVGQDDWEGWIGGRGLTYANVATGTGEWVGKVYEFCDNNPPGCPVKPLDGDVGNGILGPISFYNNDIDNTIIVDIHRLRGVTDQGFVGCN